MLLARLDKQCAVECVRAQSPHTLGQIPGEDDTQGSATHSGASGPKARPQDHIDDKKCHRSDHADVLRGLARRIGVLLVVVSRLHHHLVLKVLLVLVVVLR